MTKHNFVAWIVLALVLVSFVRGIYELGEQSLWWDESLSHYRATKPFSFILSNQMAFIDGTAEVPITPDNHPPLYFALLRMAILAAGDSEFALRFLSLASGVLVVPLLYRCGERLYTAYSGAYAGLWAATLGTLSPLYLWAQQEARPYALLTLLATASFYALIRMLQEGGASPDSDPTRTPKAQKIGWRLAYVLSTAAMLVTHYHGFLLLPAQGLIFVLAQRGVQDASRRRALWAFLAIGVIAVAVFAWGASSVAFQAEIPGYRFISLGTLLKDIFRSFPLGVSGNAGPAVCLVPFEWVSVAVLLLTLGALFTGRHRVSRSRPTLYLLLCFATPVGEIFALSFVRPAYMNIRHLILTSPFYYLLLAAGVSQARRLWARIPLALGVGVLLIGMLCSTHAYVTSYAKEDHRGWGRYLSEHVRPGDLVLINPGAIAQLYFYYVQSQASWLGFPPLWVSDEETIRQLTQIMEQHDRVWVAQSLTPHWANPGNLTLKWLEENALPIASADFYSANTTVQALAFRLRPPLLDAMPDNATPLALDFGDRLRLRGMETAATGVPTQARVSGGAAAEAAVAEPAVAEAVAAGHTLQLSLYWSATRPLERDYRMTLSLKGDDGFSWTKLDRAPYGGAYPIHLWPADRVVRDDLDIDVPPGTPPGRYWLNLSVYPADDSGPALAVHDMASGDLQGLIVPIAQICVVAPPRPPPEEEIPIPYKTVRRYGDLALLGHSYDGGTYYPGDVVRLDAYWRAIRAPRQDLTFDLQLVLSTPKRTWGGSGQVGERERVLATRSIAPAGDYAPTRWRKGEVVRGQYRLRIPIDVPEGEYAVYLAPGGERPYRGIWPCEGWPWKGGRVLLNALTVKPLDEVRSLEVPPMQHPLSANLGDRVELLGYDLGVPDVRPGQVVSCTLYWRALQVMDRNYTVFTHLVAPDGQTWGQWDNQPQRGGAPTTRWVPGQVIADPYEIPVSADAPAGQFELRVGMYDLLSMARLPVYDARGEVVSDHVVVTKIEVTGP